MVRKRQFVCWRSMIEYWHDIRQRPEVHGTEPHRIAKINWQDNQDLRIFSDVWMTQIMSYSPDRCLVLEFVVDVVVYVDICLDIRVP